MWFTHQFSALEQVADALELDPYVQDELLATDVEEYLLVSTEKVIFAALLDQHAAAYYSLLEVAETVEQITEELALVVVDQLPILLFEARTATFAFIKHRDAEEANNLIETLI
jgi:hypothetical protein